MGNCLDCKKQKQNVVDPDDEDTKPDPENPKPNPGPDPGPEEKKLRVRYEIREMSKEAQQRFVRAVKKLMENKNGPETSEWFRIASYHGWPGDSYCVHGWEAFPGWHRAYMLELENALCVADKELGGDGVLGLPYWDWNRYEINGEIFPKVLEKDLAGLPKGFLKKSSFSKFRGDPSKFGRYPVARIARNLRNSDLDNKAYNALEESQHWKAASTRWRGDSVETPHNSVHVNVGHPMNQVDTAAFDPTFWLHHCNVDRLYEAYIQKHKDSREEYESQQDIFEAQSKSHENKFDAPLRPFKLNGRDFMPADTFDIRKLGHKYDKLLEPRPQQLREVPTLAVFSDIDIMTLNGNSYVLNVFVVPKSKLKSFKVPKNEEKWEKMDEWGGCGAVFGKGPGCDNCAKREKFTETVDITKAVKKLDMCRSKIALVVMTCDAEGKMVNVKKTPVPNPTIEGPYFQQKNLSLKMAELKEDADDDPGYVNDDCVQLQKLLQKYGWYSGAIDGIYDQETADAVLAFQKRNKLKGDSVFGPKTAAMIMATRFDDKADNAEALPIIYQKGSTVEYFVYGSPGYMDRDEYLKEIDNALNQWGKCVGIKFKRGDRKFKSRLNISFSDQSSENKFLFDGKGGELARAGHEEKGSVGYIKFDCAEKWYTQSQKARRGKDDYGILPVVLHEMGHIMGLGHAENPDVVMAPYYNENRIKLTKYDKASVQPLFVKV